MVDFGCNRFWMILVLRLSTCLLQVGFTLGNPRSVRGHGGEAWFSCWTFPRFLDGSLNVLSWFFIARLASGLCQISGLASASHRPSHLESFWRWTPNFYGFCEVQEKIVEPKNKPYLPYLTWQFGGVKRLEQTNHSRFAINAIFEGQATTKTWQNRWDMMRQASSCTAGARKQACQSWSTWFWTTWLGPEPRVFCVEHGVGGIVKKIWREGHQIQWD